VIASFTCVRSSSLVQVKGAHIEDYITQSERVAILNSFKPAIAAVIADPVAYPHAAQYLQPRPIGDIASASTFVLRAKYHRKWVDAFFSRERAGALRISAVHQPTLSLLIINEAVMAIEFEYQDAPTSAPTAVPSAK
jgi:hypothetical protein